MGGLEERYYYNCPYCMARIWTTIDLTAGAGQSFTEECGVCCRPVVVHVALGRRGVKGFAAEPES